MLKQLVFWRQGCNPLFHLLQGFGSDGAVSISESNTALIDQLVSIVQHVLETKVEGALEHLVHVKIDDIVLNLITY